MENTIVHLLFILLCGCHINATPTLRGENYLESVSDGEARETAAASALSLASEELSRAIERTVTAAIAQAVKDVPMTTPAPTLIQSREEIANIVSAAVKQAMKDLTPPTTSVSAPRCNCDEQIAVALLPYQLSKQNGTEFRGEVTTSTAVKEETTTTLTPTTLTPPHCAAGYDYSTLTGHCYKLHMTKVKWVDAESKCLEEGALLAVTNSMEEAHLLADIATAAMPGWVFIHIGMYREDGSNLWKTITGENVSDSGFNVWSPGQDRWMGKEWSYGRLRHDFTLEPGVYSYKRSFICEKTPEPTDYFV